MKILEVIQLRSAANQLEILSQQIDNSLGETNRESAFVTIYRRTGLETDLAIHIRRSAVSKGAGPSDLGLRLASELKAFGLVEHSLWVENTTQKKGEIR